MKSLPGKLRAWRKRHKLTQATAAVRLGVPKESLENWEQGRTCPRGIGLAALLKAIAD